MCEERSILSASTCLCGDCALEYHEPRFCSPEFSDWLAEERESLEPVMRVSLERLGDSDGQPGCAYCWSKGANVPAAWFLDWTIDGDG